MNHFLNTHDLISELVLTPRRNLECASVDEEREVFMAQLQTTGISSVLLDITESTIIDSAGICLIIGLLKQCKKRGMIFSVNIAAPCVIKACHAMHLSDHMRVIIVKKNMTVSTHPS